MGGKKLQAREETLAKWGNLNRKLICCWTKNQICRANGLESCGLKMGIEILIFFMVRQPSDVDEITSKSLEILRINGVHNKIKWLTQLSIFIKTSSLHQIHPILRRLLTPFHNLLHIRWMTCCWPNSRWRRWKVLCDKWIPWKLLRLMVCPHCYWSLLGSDVTQSILLFLNLGSMPKALGHSLITLIPKVKNPEFISKFRPIA